ncbi:MAG: ABC transporter transmembrane domain-containing protein [Patescibacteria group bacterium]|jgi:hypothetical protein
MALEKEQIKLLRRRRGERWDNIRLRPTRENIDYLKDFFWRHKKLASLAISFLLIQALAEIGLILISHNYLKNSAHFSGVINNRGLFLFIFFGALLYLFSSFVAIKSERTFVIKLINELRLKWFKLSLYHPDTKINLEDKGSLLAKISYHLPLLATGLTNCITGSIRWALLLIILIFLSFVFGLKFLWLALLALFISGLIAASAFYISLNYVTRETTFFSRIIKLVDFSLSDWSFTKSFGREREALKDFNKLVDIDSYFRVRRDLWLRFSSSFVFVILIFLSWLVSLYYQSLTTFFSAGADGRFILIIFSIYFSRLLYEGLQVGLYSVPFTLGLALGIPTKGRRARASYSQPQFKKIIFQVAKARLFKNSPHYKNLSFCFQVGGRYLISAAPRIGKTILARLFAGTGRYAHRAWIIKTDKKRFFYNDFFSVYTGFYYIDPNFTSDRTILEVALGQERIRIKEEDFTSLSNLINSREELRGIFFEREDWRLKASKFTTNAKNILLLQILYCLRKKPFLITIDNYWLDRQDPEIDVLLRLLARELPKSILVFFASTKRDVLPYDEYYEI